MFSRSSFICDMYYSMRTIRCRPTFSLWNQVRCSFLILLKEFQIRLVLDHRWINLGQGRWPIDYLLIVQRFPIVVYGSMWSHLASHKWASSFRYWKKWRHQVLGNIIHVQEFDRKGLIFFFNSFFLLLFLWVWRGVVLR